MRPPVRSPAQGRLAAAAAAGVVAALRAVAGVPPTLRAASLAPPARGRWRRWRRGRRGGGGRCVCWVGRRGCVRSRSGRWGVGACASVAGAGAGAACRGRPAFARLSRAAGAGACATVAGSGAFATGGADGDPVERRPEIGEQANDDQRSKRRPQPARDAGLVRRPDRRRIDPSRRNRRSRRLREEPRDLRRYAGGDGAAGGQEADDFRQRITHRGRDDALRQAEAVRYAAHGWRRQAPARPAGRRAGPRPGGRAKRLTSEDSPA